MKLEYSPSIANRITRNPQTDGYIALACAILESQQDSYNRALKAWSKYKDYVAHRKALRIEEELLTEYYARLTFCKVNFKQYVNGCRHKYGLPERREDDSDWWN